MRILAVNDDGIRHEGIDCLVEALRAAGHQVLAVAPDRDRSGSSHAVTFETEMPLVRIAEQRYAYGGTPVDCVIAALAPDGLAYRPDVIVSGINAGANLGTDILCSGTAAAARQGSLASIPSIAFSVDGVPPYHFTEAARWSASRLGELLRYGRKDTFINVNYPNTGAYSGYALTYPSLRIYQNSITIKKNSDGSQSYALSYGAVRQGERQADGISDWDAVQRNKVSVSVVYSYPMVAGMTEEGEYGGDAH
jgi:5'-nucleotidase